MLAILVKNKAHGYTTAGQNARKKDARKTARTYEATVVEVIPSELDEQQNSRCWRFGRRQPTAL
jgi:hypothetical protein